MPTSSNPDGTTMDTTTTKKPKRVELNVMVDPAVRLLIDQLRSTYKSRGRVVDHAVLHLVASNPKIKNLASCTPTPTST